MKQYLLILSVFASLTSYAQSSSAPVPVPSELPPVPASSDLVIDQARDVQTPIRFRIISSSLTDTNGNRRLRISSYNDISIYNSAGAVVNTYSLEEANVRTMRLIFSKASDKCPVDIIVDRATLKVQRVTPSCDELSALDEKENFG